MVRTTKNKPITPNDSIFERIELARMRLEQMFGQEMFVKVSWPTRSRLHAKLTKWTYKIYNKARDCVESGIDPGEIQYAPIRLIFQLVRCEDRAYSCWSSERLATEKCDRARF